MKAACAFVFGNPAITTAARELGGWAVQTATRPHPRQVRRVPPCSSTQTPSCCTCWKAEWCSHGEASYHVRPYDALQFDGEGVHGLRELLTLPIRFMSVVAYGEVAPDHP